MRVHPKVKSLFDLDCWNRDRPNVHRMREWIEAMADGGTANVEWCQLTLNHAISNRAIAQFKGQLIFNRAIAQSRNSRGSQMTFDEQVRQFADLKQRSLDLRRGL